MLIGRWAQVAAVERNQRRLLALQPKPPRVLTEDAGEVAPEALRKGQVYALATGQTNPVEAQLGVEAATFSLASINGEAEPRVFQGGSRVPAGSINVGRGPARLTARQEWSESLLAQLLATPERAGARDGLIERIVRGYIIGILAVATLCGMLLFTWLTLLGFERFSVKQFERYEAALLGAIFTVLGVLMLVLKHEH
jgi:Cu2+-exporting ATPase